METNEPVTRKKRNSRVFINIPTKIKDAWRTLNNLPEKSSKDNRYRYSITKALKQLGISAEEWHRKFKCFKRVVLAKDLLTFLYEHKLANTTIDVAEDNALKIDLVQKVMNTIDQKSKQFNEKLTAQKKIEAQKKEAPEVAKLCDCHVLCTGEDSW